ncbi:hypothetical protein [Kocuria turfanensis]|uniref:hypothetical protein n=1 Tax=Kocuria turfanensis TaxID=388357 RepID=UPI0040356C9C
MPRRTATIVLGALLLAAGVLLLLEATGLMEAVGVLWGLLFLAAGAAFGVLYATDPSKWWAAIPAGALLGLGVLVLFDEIGVPGSQQWGGALFLGGGGAGFAAVYLRDHRRWWALIPAGVLITLALQALLTAAAQEEQAGGVLFFVGLAVTFALVAVLPTGAARNRWAWIPAAALAVLAALIALEATALLSAVSYLWPLALIAAGGYLIVQALRRRHDAPGHGPAPGSGSTSHAARDR